MYYGRLQFGSLLLKKQTQDFLLTCGAQHPGMLHSPSLQEPKKL